MTGSRTFISAGMTSKSVRRFLARPSSVSLSATGLSGPLPTTSNLFAVEALRDQELRHRVGARAREPHVRVAAAHVVGVAGDAQVGAAEGGRQVHDLRLEHRLGVLVERRGAGGEVDGHRLGEDGRRVALGRGLEVELAAWPPPRRCGEELGRRLQEPRVHRLLAAGTRTRSCRSCARCPGRVW